MKNQKYRGINEIKVKLLPEKSKRDYLLRLVSSIIVMIFLILNFFLVFIPRNNLLREISDIKRSIYYLNSQYNNLFERFVQIDTKMYNIKKNNEVVAIETKNVDYGKIFDDIVGLKPEFGYIEDVKFNESTSEFIIYVQFNKLIELTTYESNVKSLSYVTSVTTDKHRLVQVPEGQPRVATYFNIKIDMEKAPKVGDK